MTGMLKGKTERTGSTTSPRQTVASINVDMAQLEKELREVKSIEIGPSHVLLHCNPGSQGIPRVMNLDPTVTTSRTRIEPVWSMWKSSRKLVKNSVKFLYHPWTS